MGIFAATGWLASALLSSILTVTFTEVPDIEILAQTAPAPAVRLYLTTKISASRHGARSRLMLGHAAHNNLIPQSTPLTGHQTLTLRPLISLWAWAS
ncbi:MAG: hypothetical protein JKY31_06095 [Rhodobacteraceae bacterium]|nr:hypothetical protein [Paracoccaceae bacterium]